MGEGEPPGWSVSSASLDFGSGHVLACSREIKPSVKPAWDSLSLSLSLSVPSSALLPRDVQLTLIYLDFSPAFQLLVAHTTASIVKRRYLVHKV